MIYLLCGVPGSGKSWVINQLKDKYTHVPHDEYSRSKLVSIVFELGVRATQSLIIDCPFNERSLREELESNGLKVTPIFIVERPEVVMERYTKREGKAPTKNVITRATTIMNKVVEWDAKYGTSTEILKYFKEL